MGEEIEQAQNKGRALNDMAILVRASFQMREFDGAVRDARGSTTASSAARASTSARRSATPWPSSAVVSQPADDLAFERIVNVPKRGLGEAAVRQIHDVARGRGVPMLAAARDLVLTDELKTQAAQGAD